MKVATANIMNLSPLSLTEVKQVYSAFESDNDATDDSIPASTTMLRGGWSIQDNEKQAKQVDFIHSHDTYTLSKTYIAVVQISVWLNLVDFQWTNTKTAASLYNSLKNKLNNATFVPDANSAYDYNAFSKEIRRVAATYNASMLSSVKAVDVLFSVPIVQSPIVDDDDGGGVRSPKSSSSSALSTGAIVGIVAAVVYSVICILGIWLYYRDKSPRPAHTPAPPPPPKPTPEERAEQRRLRREKSSRASSSGMSVMTGMTSAQGDDGNRSVSGAGMGVGSSHGVNSVRGGGINGGNVGSGGVLFLGNSDRGVTSSESVNFSDDHRSLRSANSSRLQPQPPASTLSKPSTPRGILRQSSKGLNSETMSSLSVSMSMMDVITDSSNSPMDYPSSLDHSPMNAANGGSGHPRSQSNQRIHSAAMLPMHPVPPAPLPRHSLHQEDENVVEMIPMPITVSAIGSPDGGQYEDHYMGYNGNNQLNHGGSTYYERGGGANHFPQQAQNQSMLQRQSSVVSSQPIIPSNNNNNNPHNLLYPSQSMGTGSYDSSDAASAVSTLTPYSYQVQQQAPPPLMPMMTMQQQMPIPPQMAPLNMPLMMASSGVQQQVSMVMNLRITLLSRLLFSIR